MINKKILRRMIALSLISSSLSLMPEVCMVDSLNDLTITSVAHAEIKTYVGVGKAMFDFGENDESIVDTVKTYAKNRAMKNAQEQAGVYLQTYSRSINGNLTNEEISAITNNIIEVLDVQYKKLSYEAYNASRQSYGEIGVMYEATVTVRIDTDGVKKYLNLNEQGRYNIVNQNNILQQSINDNNNEFENLRKRSETVANDSGRAAITSELNVVSRTALYNQKIEEANKLFYQNNYNAAIDKCNEAIEINPNYAPAYMIRGAAYGYLEKYQNVIDDLNKAISINSNYAEVYYSRGSAYYYLKDYNRAIMDYTKAIEINPNFENAYVNRGNVYNELKQYDKSIDDFSRAIKINPNMYQAYYNRGNAYNNLQDFDKALSDYTKAIELNPNLAEAYTNRGTIYGVLENNRQAVSDFSKAISLDPNNAVAYYNRGVAYLMLNDVNKAFVDFNKAIEINPKYANAYKARGVCYEVTGDNKRAQADFKKFEQLSQNA